VIAQPLDSPMWAQCRLREHKWRARLYMKENAEVGDERLSSEIRDEQERIVSAIASARDYWEMPQAEASFADLLERMADELEMRSAHDRGRFLVAAQALRQSAAVDEQRYVTGLTGGSRSPDRRSPERVSETVRLPGHHVRPVSISGLTFTAGSLKITPTALAARLGRSRADIAHTVRLLELPDDAIELVDAGVLSKGHGKALLTEPDHHRRRVLARRAADHGWSVRALEAEIAHGGSARRTPARPPADQTAAAARLEDALTRATGCEVRARPHRRGYQIIVDRHAAQRLAELIAAHQSLA